MRRMAAGAWLDAAVRKFTGFLRLLRCLVLLFVDAFAVIYGFLYPFLSLPPRKSSSASGFFYMSFFVATSAIDYESTATIRLTTGFILHTNVTLREKNTSASGFFYTPSSTRCSLRIRISHISGFLLRGGASQLWQPNHLPGFFYLCMQFCHSIEEQIHQHRTRREASFSKLGLRTARHL